MPGAILGGLAAILVTEKVMKLKAGELLDNLAPGAVLAIAIGRWGALFTGENQGGIIHNATIQSAPYGLYNATEGAWHHALFVYESVIALVIFAFLVLIKSYADQGKLKLKSGDLALLFFILYPITQGLFELKRLDALLFNARDLIKISRELQRLQTVSVTMPIGIVCAAAAIAVLLIRQVKRYGLNLKTIIPLPMCGLLCVMHFFTVMRLESGSLVFDDIIVAVGGLGLIAVGILAFFNTARVQDHKAVETAEDFGIPTRQPLSEEKAKQELPPREEPVKAEPERVSPLRTETHRVETYDAYGNDNAHHELYSPKWAQAPAPEPEYTPEPEFDLFSDLPKAKKPKDDKRKRSLDDWNP